MKPLGASGLLVVEAKPSYLDSDLLQPTHLLVVPKHGVKGTLFTLVPLIDVHSQPYCPLSTQQPGSPLLSRPLKTPKEDKVQGLHGRSSSSPLQPQLLPPPASYSKPHSAHNYFRDSNVPCFLSPPQLCTCCSLHLKHAFLSSLN